MGQDRPLTVVRSEPLTVTSSQPLTTDQPSKPDWFDSAVAYGRGLWEKFPFAHPVEMAKGAYTAVSDLGGVTQGAWDAQGRVAAESWQAFEQGDYATGIRKFLNYMTLGGVTGIDAAADTIASGETAKGLGEATGIALGLGLPAAMIRPAGAVPRGAATGRAVPAAHRSAVEFGAREGIPMDVPTVTGNRVARGAQALSERTLGGGLIGQRARASQSQALTRTGDRLMDRTSPAAVTAEQAGTAMQEGVLGTIRRLGSEADEAYNALRAYEQATPTQTVRAGSRRVESGVLDAQGRPVTRVEPVVEGHRLAVDVQGAQRALRPLYEELKREAELVPLQGGKASALTALDRLMNGPRFSPLSIVDRALGNLKALARSDILELRTAGQGVAAQAVSQLEANVMRRARAAGPEVVQALQQGRAATVAKYQAAEVLKKIAAEPVKAFQSAVWKKDAGITQLREVAKLAPEAMPQIGRAMLDDLLTTATAKGAFGRAETLWNRWSTLGPQTKRLLFSDAALVSDLDDFFLLATKMLENPNPSGTAFVAGIGAQGYLFLHSPLLAAEIQVGGATLAALLQSPRVAQLIVRGLKMPASNRAGATALAGELSSVLGAQRLPAMIPAVSHDQPTRPRAPIGETR